jgi:hypothetical protein
MGEEAITGEIPEWLERQMSEQLHEHTLLTRTQFIDYKRHMNVCFARSEGLTTFGKWLMGILRE